MSGSKKKGKTKKTNNGEVTTINRKASHDDTLSGRHLALQEKQKGSNHFKVPWKDSCMYFYRLITSSVTPNGHLYQIWRFLKHIDRQTTCYRRIDTNRFCCFLLILSVLYLHLSLCYTPHGYLLQSNHKLKYNFARAEGTWMHQSWICLHLAVWVHQRSNDVVPNAPGSLALPQQVRRWTVGHTGISGPHL